MPRAIPDRRSFLDLPVETQLQIFGYLTPLEPPKHYCVKNRDGLIEMTTQGRPSQNPESKKAVVNMLLLDKDIFKAFAPH